MTIKKNKKTSRFFRFMTKDSVRITLKIAVTVLILFTGVMGSVYSDDIQAHFPLGEKTREICEAKENTASASQENTGQQQSAAPAKSMLGCEIDTYLDTKSFLFWVLFLITTLLFFLHQLLEEQVFRKAYDSLDNLIRTLPSEKFLTNFGSLSKQALFPFIRHVNKGNAALQQNDLEESIRSLLAILLTLLEDFERSSHHDSRLKYGANIMIFEPAAEMSAVYIKDLEHKTAFMDEVTDIQKLEGVLRLIPALSTSSETKQQAKPDAKAKEFYLPVPDKTNVKTDNGKYNVLPGGPYAYATDARFSRFSDVGTMPEWMEKYGNFKESIRTSMEVHFKKKENEHICSFISIPLMYRSFVNGNPEATPASPAAIEEGGKAVAEGKSMEGKGTPKEREYIVKIGVLNFHKNSTDILENDEKARMFLDMISPLLGFLDELLALWISNFSPKNP